MKVFLYATILLTICEVTGITFLARQDKAFCYAIGGFANPAEEDETREELEDDDDFFFEVSLSLALLTSINRSFSFHSDSNLKQPFPEIVIPPPQG